MFNVRFFFDALSTLFVAGSNYLALPLMFNLISKVSLLSFKFQICVCSLSFGALGSGSRSFGAQGSGSWSLVPLFFVSWSFGVLIDSYSKNL